MVENRRSGVVDAQSRGSLQEDERRDDEERDEDHAGETDDEETRIRTEEEDRGSTPG
jgi:hypothetical protein